jgi:hypothetical protein
MKASRAIAFVLIGLAVVLTGFGGFLDMVTGTPASRCPCGCPMCGAGRCAATLYDGPCPCKGHAATAAKPFSTGGDLRVTKEHVWNDGVFLMLAAIVLLMAF